MNTNILVSWRSLPIPLLLWRYVYDEGMWWWVTESLSSVVKPQSQPSNYCIGYL